jgi:hypothetical protein
MMVAGGTPAMVCRRTDVQRWPASSRQRFALDKWSLCRLML